MGIEFEEAMRFGFMDLHTQMTTGGINPCSLFNSIWSMTLLTELMIVDLLPHYGGNIYGALQRFFIRCAHPHLYQSIRRAISGGRGDVEQGTSGACESGETSRCLTSTNGGQVITRQENTAIRTASSLFGLIFGSIGLCIGFWGVDLSSVRFSLGAGKTVLVREITPLIVQHYRSILIQVIITCLQMQPSCLMRVVCTIQPGQCV